MSDRAAIDMTQPFRFLDLPIELRFMVYEQLPTRSHVGLVAEGYFKFSLISHDCLPRIDQTCKLLYAEAVPFIRRLRRLLPPPRAVFEVSDREELELLYYLIVTLVSAQGAVRRDLPKRISTAECHEAVYAALDEWVCWAEGAAYEWVQRNVGALVEWIMSFYFMRSQTSSRVILEIALSGSSSISDEDLRNFVYNVEFEVLAEKWVHVYEVPSVPEIVRGKIGRCRFGRYELQDFYKGVIDKQTWEREWA